MYHAESLKYVILIIYHYTSAFAQIREDIIKLVVFLGSIKVSNRLEKAYFLCLSCHLIQNAVMHWIHKARTNVDMLRTINAKIHIFHLQKRVRLYNQCTLMVFSCFVSSLPSKYGFSWHDRFLQTWVLCASTKPLHLDSLNHIFLINYKWIGAGTELYR